jgi:DNA polymerase III delta subunit
MLRLIHGDNNLASFQALEAITKDFSELAVSRLEGRGLSLEQVKEALETPSMDGRRLVVIEDLSLARSQSLLAELKKYLTDLPAESELVLYERKLLPPESPLLTLTKKVQGFPKTGGLSVFAWADEVGQRNLAASFSGWQKLVDSGEEPEYLFLMLVRQFRLLLLLKLGEKPKVPEFVRQKLLPQLKDWTVPELKAAYQELLTIDRNNKKGMMPLSVGVPYFLSLVGRVKNV